MQELILVVTVAVMGGFVISGLRQPGDRQVGAFARVYSVDLTERNAVMIRAQIARMRRWRFGGAVVGAGGAWLFSMIGANALTISHVLAGVAAGFAVGVIGAELTRRSPPSSGRAAALASPRSVRQYIAPWILATMTLIGMTVAGFLIHAAIERTYVPGPFDSIDPAPTRWSSVILGSVAWCALSGGTFASLRKLAQAPEPAPSRDIFDANRAIRASAMVTVFGAYWMGMSALGARVIWPMANNDSGAASWVTGIAGVVMTLGMSGGFLVCVNALPRTGGYGRVPKVPTTQRSSA